MHIKLLNHHKVFLVRGVGVKIEAWVSVRPGAHRMFTADLWKNIQWQWFASYWSRRTGGPVTTNSRRPPCLVYQIVLYFLNDLCRFYYSIHSMIVLL